MKILNAQVTANTKRLILTLAVDVKDADEVHQLKNDLKDGGEIGIILKDKKRSINANSYYWSLIGKIASATKQSTTEVHNQMLSDYGVPWLDADFNRTFVQLPKSVNHLKDETLHLKATSKVLENSKGIKYRVYVLMKPSHMYTTKEFSDLLDGAISEAKNIGIDIGDEEWIERIKNTLISAK